MNRPCPPSPCRPARRLQQHPPLQFYTSALAAAGRPAPPPSTGASLVVGPVSVPATIDRLLIVRLAGRRAEVAGKAPPLEAAPLKTEIARRVAADLARRSPTPAAVGPGPIASIAEPTLSADRRAALRGRTASSGSRLEAVWTVRQAGRDIASRRFSATEAITAPTFDALASAHGSVGTRWWRRSRERCRRSEGQMASE